MINEGVDLGLEIAWQVVVLEQDAVLQRLMPALDLALGLGMEGSATNVPDAAVLEPFRQRCKSSRCRSAGAADLRPWRSRNLMP